VTVAFGVVFGVFVVLILGVAVIAVRWAVHRDRAARDRSARDGPAAEEGRAGADPPGPPPSPLGRDSR